jgi:hypothetical protein
VLRILFEECTCRGGVEGGHCGQASRLRLRRVGRPEAYPTKISSLVTLAGGKR